MKRQHKKMAEAVAAFADAGKKMSTALTMSGLSACMQAIPAFAQQTRDAIKVDRARCTLRLFNLEHRWPRVKAEARWYAEQTLTCRYVDAVVWFVQAETQPQGEAGAWRRWWRHRERCRLLRRFL